MTETKCICIVCLGCSALYQEQMWHVVRETVIHSQHKHTVAESSEVIAKVFVSQQGIAPERGSW